MKKQNVFTVKMGIVAIVLSYITYRMAMFSFNSGYDSVAGIVVGYLCVPIGFFAFISCVYFIVEFLFGEDS